jgi:hypothetical protein
MYCERALQAAPCELPGRTHLADSSHSNLAGVLLESLSSAPIPSLIFHPLAETRLSNQILLQLLLFPPQVTIFAIHLSLCSPVSVLP